MVLNRVDFPAPVTKAMPFESFSESSQPSEEDTFAAARKLFCTPQEVMSRACANDTSLDNIFGAISVAGGGSGSTGDMWPAGSITAQGAGQDFSSVRAAANITPPAQA
jgi:hypothetical protein